MELLDHKVVLFFIFQGNSIVFFLVAAPIAVSPTGHEDSLVSTSSTTLFVALLTIGILTGVWCSLTVVIMCISLMISDVEYLVTFLLVVRTYSLECLFRLTDHFLIGFFVFVVLSCMGSSSSLDINLLCEVSLANTFSHSVCYLFVSLMLFLAKPFSLM